jgi:peptidyl-prolyl cis-trans isomerase B (cyclophilin B)
MTLDELVQCSGFDRAVLRESMIDMLNENGMLEMAELPPPETAAHELHASTVTLCTGVGDVEIELSSSRTPKTVANFVALAKKGFYDGTEFFGIPMYHAIAFGSPSSTNHERSYGGYVFDNEVTTPKPHAQGDVFMYAEYPHLNSTRVGICLRSGSDRQQHNVVFGRAKDLSVLGKLTRGLKIVKVKLG